MGGGSQPVILFIIGTGIGKRRRWSCARLSCYRQALKITREVEREKTAEADQLKWCCSRQQLNRLVKHCRPLNLIKNDWNMLKRASRAADRKPCVQD